VSAGTAAIPDSNQGNLPDCEISEVAPIRFGEEVGVSVRRVLGVVVALACVVLLSSCSLLPKLPPVPGDDNPEQESNVEMQHIADAVKDHDAAALKKLFSPAAREKATDLDGGLKYFLSFFPSGRMKILELESDASGGPQGSEGVYPTYEVSADGKKYDLFFADFVANDAYPDNVGIYALGVGPHNADPLSASGAPKPFYAWSGAFDNGNFKDPGTPGVYVPQK
jgi:hypothetical protein